MNECLVELVRQESPTCDHLCDRQTGVVIVVTITYVRYFLIIQVILECNNAREAPTVYRRKQNMLSYVFVHRVATS